MAVAVAVAWGAPVEAEPAAPAPAPVAVAGAAPEPFVVCIQPLGEHDPAAVPVVSRGIEHVYGAVTRALPPRPLPAMAWYPPRRRWRGERLLDHMKAEVLPDSGCSAIVGLTAVDISVTRDPEHYDWGVLGVAYLDDHVAVISSFRARRGVGRAATARRLVKVANHELGHVLGMPHGGAPGCIMNDAGGSVRTVDRERGTLCPDERAAVEKKLGGLVPARDAIDWRLVLGP